MGRLMIGICVVFVASSAFLIWAHVYAHPENCTAAGVGPTAWRPDGGVEGCVGRIPVLGQGHLDIDGFGVRGSHTRDRIRRTRELKEQY